MGPKERCYRHFTWSWEQHQFYNKNDCITDEQLVRRLRIEWYDQLVDKYGLNRSCCSTYAGLWYKEALANPAYRRDNEV